MWVSILQNGRKKDKDISVDRVAQLLKNPDKATLSQTLSRSQLLASSRVQDRRSTNQKQNVSTGHPRLQGKCKSNFSASNIFVNRTNFLGNYYNMLQDCDTPKRTLIKQVQEQSLTIAKNKKNQESVTEEVELEVSGEQKKNAYFLRILSKKNKQRSQFNMNIHNSIFTFKEFMKACQLAPAKPVDSRITAETQNRKTIVFDMDETLIHTNQTMTPNFQIKVPFRSVQGRIGYGFVEVRPHCKDMLKRLSQHFDVIIFTASTQAYADQIIDHIDPQRVVQHRLYRESCSFVKSQIFVKDLRVFGRKLSNIVLVDNAPYSYMMQLDNAIPIIPYYRGKEDDELVSLQQYLMKLKDVEDVRTVNREYFKLNEYVKYQSHERLVNKLYGEWLK